MAYEKQTWNTGDVITEEKLNHMEDGIATGGALVLTEDENGTLNYTWEEIKNVVMSGRLVGMPVIREEGNYKDWLFSSVYSVGLNTEHNEYGVTVSDKTYITDSPTGYPSYNSN